MVLPFKSTTRAGFYNSWGTNEFTLSGRLQGALWIFYDLLKPQISLSLSLSLSLVAVVVMVDGDAWTFSHSKYHNTNRYYLGLSVHPQ